jgi:thymidylate synthase (FAD)
MKVRLISYTAPSQELISCGIETTQDLVSFCARVSNPSNQYNSETSEKLIKYLIRNKHWSPLEVSSVCLEIETTRDIARQILRHRSFTFQEFSQRYADPVKELSFEVSEARLQDSKNRQNSIDVDDGELQIAWRKVQSDVIDQAKKSYEWAVNNGIAKELARKVLPEGLTASRMYVNGTIRSWIHYIETRSDPATQKEHREIALECAKAIAEIFPFVIKQ